jgi:formylglycine-generating enzyme required for sulfatase activity
MVLIPAGTFMMGSPDIVGGNEHPQHQVTMRSFYMGKYEVTQAQYRAVMGTKSGFKGDNLPVDVSWDDAVEFCRRLSQMTGREYRLPSEAEWEYACRAGTTTDFAFGNSLSSEQANFDGTLSYRGAAKGVYRRKTTPVGSFQPNAWGLYDMHGNVEEWCQDWYHEGYNGAPADGSAWESGGEPYRVLRGGGWNNDAYFLRSTARVRFVSGFYYEKYASAGFRVVAVVRS